MRKYFSAFIDSVGGRWFMLPGFITGCLGLVTGIQSMGYTVIPDLSLWALTLFALFPISMWSIVGLTVRVTKLNGQLHPRLMIFKPGRAIQDVEDIANIEQREEWLVRVKNTSSVTVDDAIAKVMITDLNGNKLLSEEWSLKPKLGGSTKAPINPYDEKRYGVIGFVRYTNGDVLITSLNNGLEQVHTEDVTTEMLVKITAFGRDTTPAIRTFHLDFERGKIEWRAANTLVSKKPGRLVSWINSLKSNTQKRTQRDLIEH